MKHSKLYLVVMTFFCMESLYSFSPCLASKKFTEEEFTKFTKKIEYRFEDKSLLSDALTHSSIRKEKPDEFQRLEHLGDRVLSLVIAEFLYDENPDEEEGFLSQESEKYTRNVFLVKAARKLGLLSDLEYEKDKLDPRRGEESLSSDAYEALIGAIFKDSGLESARKFILTHFDLLEPQVVLSGNRESSKIAASSSPLQKPSPSASSLKESEKQPPKTLKEFRKICQYKSLTPPQYYEVIVKIGEKTFTAESKSKKEAKQLAAKKAYEEQYGAISKKKAVQSLAEKRITKAFYSTICKTNSEYEVEASYSGRTEKGKGASLKKAKQEAAKKLYEQL